MLRSTSSSPVASGRGASAWLLLALVAAVAPAAAQGDYEKPPVLRARDLAPPELLKGPNFQVDENVPTDGLLATFSIKSDFGPFEARGPGMLHVRVNEIKAIDALSKMEKSDVFAKALANSAKRTGESLAKAAENPVETVKGIPEGVGRFFDRVGRSVRTGTQKTEDYVGQSQSQPGGADPNKTAEAAGQGAASVGKSVFGYDDARRRLAKPLGVDPYTTNPVLSKKLDDIAYAAWAGELGMDQAVGMVPGGRVITATRTWVSDLVWDTSPGDLKVRIDKQLKALGVEQDPIDRFLRQKWFTLSTQTALEEALYSMGPGPGRADVITWALTADSVLQTRFMAGAVAILAEYHRTAAPIQKIRVAGTLIGETASGALVIAAPVDYIAWTERAAGFVQRPDLAAKEHQLWVFGHVSPRARQELTARGWVIREGVTAGIVVPGGGSGAGAKPPAPQ